jgi:peptidoglycan/xylan/chitin deacetylase (PgdA/CDA1 family)
MLVPTAGPAAAQVVDLAEGPPETDVTASGASAPTSTESCPAGFLAMTFDDGPQEHTPAVLDTLVDTGTLATFFVLGRAVEQQPWVTQRTDAEGHGVANHSHEHERLTELSEDQIVETIERADAAIRDAGVVPLELMRPPYGDTDQRVRQAIESTGYLEMLWDVDSRDWESTASEIQENVSAGIEPGAVLLFHDGSSNTPETIAALPGIVDEARDRGYCFTTMDATGSLVPLRFVDAGGLVHTAAIERIAAADITLGCAEGDDGVRYCPAGSVNRAQMASFLDRALDLPEAGDQGFVDVPRGSDHAGAIDRVAAAGITVGCAEDEDGTRYCPRDPVNRAQMASFLDRALDLPTAGDQGFVDVPRGSDHAEAIDRIVAEGIAAGCDADGPRYCPRDPISRAQMATFLDAGIVRR